LFVVFFPQLVAGPIVRASEFLPQLRVRPRVSAAALEEGLFRIFKGLVKKIVFGDLVAARLADPVFAGPGDYSQLEILVALYAFTLQMYADFSAYSDLAIGIARLLGYTLPENFDRPYQARNVGEFWRRWHMTLSTWLRDYLFFPLGGSQGSALRTYFNLWLTMFLVGMWHGASWNFVVYGNLHALAIVFNRWNRLRAARSGVVAVLHTLLAAAAMAAVFGLAARGLLRLEDDAATVLAAVAAVSTLLVMWVPEGRGRAVTLLHVALTFHFTVLSRVFFRAEDLDASRELAAGLLRFDGLGLRPGGTEPVVWAALLIGFAVHFAPRRLVDEVGLRWFRRLPGPVLGALFCLLALGLTHLLSGAPRAFIYFQF
jgi:D-alanyl-lipoteichoic acid acyltransferase DltB (MBOAT superfamily)